MGYLKSNSVPAQQEFRARAACQIIAMRSKAKKNRKSYVITSRDAHEAITELHFFKNHKFGRG